MKNGLVSQLFSGRVRANRFLLQVHQCVARLRNMTDQQLTETSLSLAHDYQCGKRKSVVAVQAFALVHEAIHRVMNIELYDVQHLAGWMLTRQRIAEMQTGEGKTVSAALPAFYFSLSGRQVHLATANDYLAQRDAELLSPVFKLLGKSVGVIHSGVDGSQRGRAYRADIVYGTASEFGFDFLKERMRNRILQQNTMLDANGLPMPTGSIDRYFMLIDEADSLMLDEASTPLIIGASENNRAEAVQAAFEWAEMVASKFLADVHLRRNEKKQIELTSDGQRLVRQLSADDKLQSFGLGELYEYIRRAIMVNSDFHRGTHYLVQDGEIVIIDQFTGRVAEGRQWQRGIHQAIEAKEQIEITMSTAAAARITLQDFFLQYESIAGMTGTAWTSGRELKKVYKRHVVRIPTNKPSLRKQLPTIVFPNWQEKLVGILQEVHEQTASGRSVLIGTTSVTRSEQISKYLMQHGITPQVLNAQNHAEEADVIAAAGESGRVTVATNMAGRGTDIKIAQPVKDAGGLHVILTEIHDSRRIDRQLIGRCARQGDPGSYRMMLSGEDEILKTARKIHQMETQTKTDEQNAVDPPQETYREADLIAAQRTVEKRKLRDRLTMLYHERKRNEVLYDMGFDPFLDRGE